MNVKFLEAYEQILRELCYFIPFVAVKKRQAAAGTLLLICTILSI
jgi:hypothetical protein